MDVYDLADEIDARCEQLGDGASDWMNAAFVDVMALTPDAPEWLSACVEILKSDYALHREVNAFAREVMINLERGDGVRIDRTIAGRELRAHPFGVLGRQEADRRRLLAVALQTASHGSAWGFDSAEELHIVLCDVPGMTQHLFDVFQQRLKA